MDTDKIQTKIGKLTLFIVSLALILEGLMLLTHTDHNRTWRYRVEDDAPVCWVVRDGTMCGPLSWTPTNAKIVEVGK